VTAGRPEKESDEAILEVFQQSEDPFLIASEVAEDLSIGQRATYKRLKKLEKDGKLESKSIGGRGTGWWLVED